MAESRPAFRRLALIGLGLIGSSIAWGARRRHLADEIVGFARSAATRKRALELGFVDQVTDSAAEAATGADLAILCVPVGAVGTVAAEIAPSLDPGAILSDVGSVKGSVLTAVLPHLPLHVSFVPAHPIAGTEHSGPDAGFAELFEGRWCILTPPEGTDAAAIERLAGFWRALGSRIEVMDAGHHDRVLAITSHLPHLIAYSIVDTAVNLEDDIKREVIRFSASGFRDFTRIAASDPVMWRDVFLNNKDACLDMLQRFNEDLTALQRAIRRSDGDTLEQIFTRTRAIRRGIVDARQADYASPGTPPVERPRPLAGEPEN